MRAFEFPDGNHLDTILDCELLATIVVSYVYKHVGNYETRIDELKQAVRNYPKVVDCLEDLYLDLSPDGVSSPMEG